MIPVSTFNLFVGIFVALIIYAWVDHRNKLYGNIAAAIMATIIGGTLTILIYIGAVQSDEGMLQVSDTPTAGMLLTLTLLIAVYTFFMAMDAKEEYERSQEP